jgi:hypothetical protein
VLIVILHWMPIFRARKNISSRIIACHSEAKPKNLH